LDHLVIRPDLDLDHRLLLARGRRGADAFELLERAVALAGSLLSALTAESARMGRAPNGARARFLADQVRLVLSDQTNLGLTELARVGASRPFTLAAPFATPPA
jgi:hypothetical protein